MRFATHDAAITLRLPREHRDDAADRYGFAVSDLLRRGLELAVREFQEREPGRAAPERRRPPPLGRGPFHRRQAASEEPDPLEVRPLHTAASEAIATGDGAEEVSWQLGRRNSVVTRMVYVQEIQSAERTAKRRANMEASYGSMLGSAMEAADRSNGGQTATLDGAEVLPLRQIAADQSSR